MTPEQEHHRQSMLDAVKMLRAMHQGDLDGYLQVLHKYGHPDNPDYLALLTGLSLTTEGISEQAALTDQIPYQDRLDLIEHGILSA